MTNKKDPRQAEITALNPGIVDLDVRDMSVDELERRLELSIASPWGVDCGLDSCGTYDHESTCEVNECATFTGPELNCGANACGTNEPPPPL